MQVVNELVERELGKPLEKASAEEVEAAKERLGIYSRTGRYRTSAPRRQAFAPVDTARANVSAGISGSRANKRGASGSAGTGQGALKRTRFG